jgi:hypothetical protein
MRKLTYKAANGSFRPPQQLYIYIHAETGGEPAGKAGRERGKRQHDIIGAAQKSLRNGSEVLLENWREFRPQIVSAR